MRVLCFTSIVVLITSVGWCASGKSKLCDDINYLSTGCLKTEILPMEFKDKKVALEKAKAESSDTKINIITFNEKKDKPVEDIGVNIIRKYFKE